MDTQVTRRCPTCLLQVTAAQDSCPVDGTSIAPEYAKGSILDGKYRLTELLGAGGMGVVYRAVRLTDDRTVAIKMLHSTVIDEQAVLRFQREGKAGMALRHPNIASVLEFSLSNTGKTYLVMEYIEGPTMHDVILAKAPMDIDITLEAMIQVCRGLAHAHENGILHRDIKPGNLILASNVPDRESIKILDFGIAKMMNDASLRQRVTSTGVVLGTPTYMSPEQAKLEHADPRSDLYSLGCVMFECLTGTTPFTAKSVIGMMSMHAEETPPLLKHAALGREYPEELESIVKKLLAKDPANRYQSAQSLEFDLENFRDRKQVIAHVTDKVAPKPRKKANFLILTLILVSLLVVGFVSVVAYRYMTLPPAAVHKVPDSFDIPAESVELKGAALVQNLIDKGDSKVDLSYQVIVDTDLKPLRSFPSCSILNLASTKITDEGLQYLQTLNNLYKLILEHTDIDDKGLPYLSELTNLRFLDLSYTLVHGNGFRNLNKLKLTELNLTGSHIKTAEIANLRSLAQVSALDISNTELADQSMYDVGKVHNLRKLSLANMAGITNSGIANLVASNPSLIQLNLYGDKVDDGCVESLLKSKDLRILDVSNTRITQDGILRLSALKTLLFLNRLNVVMDYKSINEFQKKRPQCRLLSETEGAFNQMLSKL